jgi:hypothetical protein
MNYAQISNGVVTNIIVLTDNSLVSVFSQGYDALVRVDTLTPSPNIGWLYDGTNFSAPGLPNDAYGNTVTLSTDGVTDTYTVNKINVYTFPAGTSLSVVYLTLAIKANILTSQAAVQSFVTSRYTLDTRFNLNALYILATQSGLTNRATYITQLFTWAQAVVAYAATYMNSVSAMTNVTTIVNTQPNFTTLTAADPCVTPVAAIQINN